LLPNENKNKEVIIKKQSELDMEGSKIKTVFTFRYSASSL